MLVAKNMIINKKGGGANEKVIGNRWMYCDRGGSLQ